MEKIRSALKFIKDKILYPFKYDLPYFILLWIIVSLPAIYQKIAYPEYFSSTLVLIFYAVTYIIVFLLNLNQYVAKILKPVIFIIYTILSIINFYCIYMYNCWFSNDFIEIIKATNPDEAKEYIETYISTYITVLAAVFFIVAAIAYWHISKIKLKTHCAITSLAFLPLFTPIRIRQHPDVLDVIFTGKFTWSHDDIFDLRNHLSHPHICSVQETTINPTVVVIIGESFTPLHSSLYGYDKDTNPLLQKKQKDGNLIVFPNVTSPHTSTKPVFKYLLNTYQLGEEKQYKYRWYESVNLIDVTHVVGYHTSWFANAIYGFGDNEITGYPNICNEFVYMTKDNKEHKYDGEVLKYNVRQSNKPQAVFYHLLGQHYQYSERYPAEYDVFKSTDYPTFTDSIAQIIAEYDNATLYNDYVVNSIIDKYKNKDAIIFYFSDHGEDVYATDPNYYGHAKETPESQIIGKKIPFMVYLSSRYKQLRPKTTKRIHQSTSKEFCTDKLIYTVMDAIGYKFADNNDVAKYSLFATN